AMPMRLQATAGGRVRPRQRALDLSWTATVDATRPGRGGPPRLEAAHLTAREQLALRGTARAHGASVTFDLSATGGIGGLRASGESRGSVFRRLALDASS